MCKCSWVGGQGPALAAGPVGNSTRDALAAAGAEPGRIGSVSFPNQWSQVTHSKMIYFSPFREHLRPPFRPIRAAARYTYDSDRSVRYRENCASVRSRGVEGRRPPPQKSTDATPENVGDFVKCVCVSNFFYLRNFEFLNFASVRLRGSEGPALPFLEIYPFHSKNVEDFAKWVYGVFFLSLNFWNFEFRLRQVEGGWRGQLPLPRNVHIPPWKISLNKCMTLFKPWNCIWVNFSVRITQNCPVQNCKS